MNKLFEWFGQPFEQMSKTDNVEQTGRLFERMKILSICTTGCAIGSLIILMNKLLKWFVWPFKRMSKTDNVEWTSKPFEQMKMLLICMIGCTIGLPIVQMTKLLKQFAKPFLAHGLIREWAMLLCIFFHFICCCSQFQGLYSHDQKWRLFQFVIEITFIVIVLNY